MCDCPPGTKPQEYTNQVTVDFPHGVSRPRISVDRCLLAELRLLWKQGIVTNGCCCGHNEWREWAYIGVRPADIPRMKALGYTVRRNPMRPNDEDSFIPLSV